MTLLQILLLLLLQPLFVLGAADKHRRWRDKKNRFGAFRFEVPAQSNFDLKSLIQSRADNHFCFGWVQDSPRGTIVGEVRCKREPSKQMLDFISALAADQSSNVLIYEDSLIRLHPSSFKIMPPGRNTCFREEPHKCSHLFYQGGDGTALHER